MKRSRTASLLLMGSAPLLLTACSHDPDAVRSGLYTSVEACVAAGNDATICNNAYANAAQEARTNAPAFASSRECEARYGDLECVERSVGGHSFFMPMMAGFMLAQAMRGNSATGDFRSAPAFRDNANGWRQAPWQNQNQNQPTGGGYAGGGTYAGGFRGGNGGALETVTSAPDRAVTTTVSRGGFGSRSAGRGFGFRGFGS